MFLEWLNITGLVIDLTGAIFLSFGLIINDKEAIHLGVARYGSEQDEENKKLPQVQDRIKQSKNTKIGLVLLGVGFILQIIANWP